MANTFTPSEPTSGPWYIDREDCIGDSLGYINANTNYLGTRSITNSTNIQTLSSQIIAATLPGTAIQSSTRQQTLTGTVIATTSITDSGLTEITISSRQPTSKILIELTGGRQQCATAATGFYTWFYVSENSLPYVVPVYGGTGTALNAAEFVYSPTANMQGPHVARLLYTPGPTINTISAKVYIQRYNATGNYNWNLSDTNASIPFIFSITEIKS